MADRPILFSRPMVSALLSGRKTQTRRIIKPRKHFSLFDGTWTDSYVLDPGNESWRQQELRFKVGDRLWVKETWRAHGWHADCVEIAYAAQRGLAGWSEQHEQIRYPGGDKNAFKYYAPKGPDFWRPSIFMPRWASRITLIVTDVRVERLQDISEADAVSEGAELSKYPGMDGGVMVKTNVDGVTVTPSVWYRWLWDEINGKGAWDANPWVAAYTFTVIKQNIDEVK